MDEEKGKGSVLGFIAVAVVIYFLYRLLFAPKWTLMMCSEVMGNGADCQTNGYVNKNAYGSMDACFTAGRSLLGTYPSFECGKGCKFDGNFWICSEICNKNGRCSE